MPDTPSDTRNEPLTVSSAATEIEGLLFPAKPEKTAPAKEKVEKSTPEGVERPESLEPDKSLESEAADDNAAVEGEDASDTDTPAGEVEEDVAKEKPEQTYRAKVRGEEVEVTLDELLNGYSRQSDYTRSKQELAEARRKFEAEEIPKVRESASKYVEGLAQIEEALAAIAPQEPDWDAIMIEAPETLATEKAKWDVYRDRMARIAQEKEAAQAELAKHYEAERKAFVQAESERLVELVPAWKDTETANKEKAEIAKYALSLGFSEDDLKQVTSANAMLVLRNAYLYDLSQKKAPVIRKQIEDIVTATPGPKDEARPKVTKQKAAQQRLAQTGSVKDAAAALELSGILDD